MFITSVRCPAMLLSLILLTGCRPPAGGPVAIQTTEVKNLKQDGDFFIGGTPTPAGLDDLKNRGVTTVIDLRRSEEASYDEEAAARARGLRYIHLPMSSDELTTQQADRFVDALRAHQHEKVLIHCAGGSRAGAMYGLYLGVEEKCPTKDALQRAKQAGLKSKKLAKQVEQQVEQRRSTP